MHTYRRRSASLRRVVLLTVLLLAAATAAAAQTRVQIVHRFPYDPFDLVTPVRPAGGLILATDGAFYGTALPQDYSDGGAVFRMTSSGAVTLLHTFVGGAADGARAITGVIQAGDGGFYGTTERGGTANLGVVYRVSAEGVFFVLHSFTGGPEDGASPAARLVEGRDGALYGTTRGGGAFDLGTAFRMTTTGNITLLHSFAGEPTEGARPTQPLVEGRDGNFYGGTTAPEPWPYANGGTIFRMSPAGAVTVLRRLSIEEDGIAGYSGLALNDFPLGALLEATDGSFYGTTGWAGPHGAGTIFRIASDGTFTKLHDFSFEGTQGHSAELVQAADGTIYGGDYWMQGNSDRIAVFSVTPEGIVRTIVTLVQEAVPDCPYPQGDGARFVVAPDGSLWGTATATWRGGGPGAIFRITTQAVEGFDGDAKADMTVYDRGTGAWRLLTSASGYQTSRTIHWGGAGYTPVPADYDGDARLDAAVYRASTGVWSILGSRTDFQQGASYAWGGVGYVPVPGDYDGDRQADLTVYRPATGQWHILQSRDAFTTAATIVFGGIGAVPVGGDYDGDGITDLALYRPATGVWQILTSRSGFTALLTKTLGGPGYTPVPGYYDTDLIADIAVYDQANGDWWALQSSTDFSTTWHLAWGGTGYAAAPGDYDGDALNDLAVYRGTTGEWFILQSSTGFTTTRYAIFGDAGETVVTSGPVRLSWTDTSRATDYDGDGASDLAVYEPATGTWFIRDSSAGFNTTRSIPWGGAGDTPVPGDYDGDGQTDVATFTDTSGAWSVQLTRGGTLAATLGSAGDIPVPRDYDGDLVTDLAVYHPSTGHWRLLLSSTAFTLGPLIPWGGPDWTPVPGDYDADGKADLGTYRSSTGEWRVLLAANTFTTQLTMLWGGPGQTAVPGDYDGDGAIDVTVCRTSTRRWWVLKSGFTYTTAFGVMWGDPIDTPLAGDYDGDGIADMGGYDSTTGEWRLRLSSSDFTLTLARTLGGTGFIVPRTP